MAVMRQRAIPGLAINMTSSRGGAMLLAIGVGLLVTESAQ
jgi:hypothetical protein